MEIGMKNIFLFTLLILLMTLPSCWDDKTETPEVKVAPVLLSDTLKVVGNIELDSSIFIWAYINGEVENYQWFKGALPLADNYDTLFLDSLTYADTGYYRLIISNSGGSDTSAYYHLTFNPVVIPVNNKPVFTTGKPDSIYTVVIGTALSIPFTATDADSTDSVLSYWVTSSNLPSSSDTGTVLSQFIWNTDSVGTYSLTFNVTDQKDTTSKNVAVTVRSKGIDTTSNSAPQFILNKPATSYVVKEGTPLTIPYAATDLDDNDSLLDYWIVFTNFTADSIAYNDSQFIWYTPVVGEYEIALHVTDGKDSISIDVSIKVEAETGAPVLTIAGHQKGETIEINEGDSITLNLTASSQDSLDVVTIVMDTTVSNIGLLTGANNKSWTYIPGYDVASINNPIDTVAISFIATSTQFGADTFNLTVHVNNINRKPEVTGSVVAAIEEVATSIKLATSDADGDTLFWEISKLPTSGLVSIDSGVVFSEIAFDYTSINSSAAFNDSLEVIVTDGADSASLVVSILVNADNDAPVITGHVSDPFVLTEGVAFTLSIDSITVTDPDDDISSLTFTVLPGTGYSESGNVVTVTSYSTATIGIIVSVKDDQNATVIDTLNASVIEVNDVPVIAGNGTVQWYEDNVLDLSTVYFNITDSDDDVHTVFAVAGTNYTFDATGNNITPAKDWDKDISINVKATDGEDTSAVYQVNLSLIAVNDTPKVTIGVPLEGPSIEFGGTFNIPITVEDPEGIKSLKIYRSNSDVIFSLNGDFSSDTIPWTNSYRSNIIGKNEIKVVVVDSNDVWVTEKDSLTVIGSWISDSMSIAQMLDSNNMYSTGVGSFGMMKENDRITYLQLFTSNSEFFTKITKDIHNLNALKTLQISNQNIKTLPPEIRNLKELDSLYISACHNLVSLPNSIEEMDKLRSLVIMSSSIMTLPSTLGKNSSLKRIFIVDCKVDALPESIRNSNISYLSIRSCELSSLPFILGDLPNLILDGGSFPSNRLHPSSPPEDWALWLDSKFTNGRDEWYYNSNLSNGTTQKDPL